MTNIELITFASHPEDAGVQNLILSLNKFKWPFEVITEPWRGFSTKLIHTYHCLKKSPYIDAFFFCDANDVLVLGTLQEAYEKIEAKYGIDKIVCSSERGCWPKTEWEEFYTERFDHRFNYLNSGLYYAPSKLFMELMEEFMPEYSDDDQEWFTDKFLFHNNDRIVLDNNCEVFQSYSFLDEDDYFYGKTMLYNLKTQTEPVLIHGNGRTPMDKILELL